MTVQTLQNNPEAVIAEECRSIVCRIAARIGAALESSRERRAKRAIVNQLRRLDARRLEDIGLDDPQRQVRDFGVYFDSAEDDLVDLRHRLDVRR